ncbi:xyloglucan fucosyltransferase [Medicago truncatula]|uniref:Fucosyltransferase n=1 Tax=Medicago truncatula TaxID=3880 RepID=G7JEI4_MEDTR|nr:xyloglucan fucosyltransferase [Medicago truncatula]
MTKNCSTVAKVVLVASLYPQYGDNLKMMYMNKSKVIGEVIEVYQPSGEEQQKFNDNHLSDVLVTTYQSTFDYVAKGLGNSRPWILYNSIQGKEICEREFTLEFLHIIVMENLLKMFLLLLIILGTVRIIIEVEVS